MPDIDKNEQQHRKQIIREAIERFLDDNDLEITTNNIDKLQRNLSLWFQDKSPLSTSFIYNYLQETYEYQELNIKHQQGLGDAADETPIINILINSDPRSPKTKYIKLLKKLAKPIVFIAILVIIGHFTLAEIQSRKSASTLYRQQISVMEATLLKEMVKEIVETNKANGTAISTTQIWRELKKSPEITKHGTTRSYKNFNRAQYDAAQQYLVKLLAEAKAAQAPAN